MPLPLQQIGAIDAGRLGADQHLPGAWPGNRPGGHAENLGSAGRCDIDTRMDQCRNRRSSVNLSTFLRGGQGCAARTG